MVWIILDDFILLHVYLNITYTLCDINIMLYMCPIAEGLRKNKAYGDLDMYNKDNSDFISCQKSTFSQVPHDKLGNAKL